MNTPGRPLRERFDDWALVQQIRPVFPRPHVLVDIDDGYGDPEVAAHVRLAEAGTGNPGVKDCDSVPHDCPHGVAVLPAGLQVTPAPAATPL